jgi:DNA-binding Lrp family transcriptional regulator
MASNIPSLDDLDWEIIKELNFNPRINIKDLADKLNRSRNTIASRLGKLEENGYSGDSGTSIIKSVIIPNYRKLGAISGYILATCTPGESQQEIAQKVAKLNGIEDISVVTGEFDFIIRINAKSMEQIGDTIIQDLRKEQGIDKTITCITFWNYRGKQPFELLNSER